MARHDQPELPRRTVRGMSTGRVIAVSLAVVWTVWWFGWTLVFVILAVAQWTGLDPHPDSDTALGALVIAALTGALGTGGVFVVRGLRTTRSPATWPRHEQATRPWDRVEHRRALPRPGSAARAPMWQLAQAEAAMAEVMHQLSVLVSAAVAVRVWRVASGKAAELRADAARLEATEKGTGQGAAELARRIEGGLHAYQSLLAAAGDVVLAGTATPTADLTDAKDGTDATDGLAGLAAALRELSTDG